MKGSRAFFDSGAIIPIYLYNLPQDAGVYIPGGGKAKSGIIGYVIGYGQF